MKLFIIFFVSLILNNSLVFSQYPIIADHRAVNEFDSIPENYLPEAAKLRIMFRHKSVGVQFNNGLECIQGTWLNNPKLKPCADFPAYKYDRRNWSCRPRDLNGWYEKIDGFVAETNIAIDSFDIFSFKMCYLEGIDQFHEPCGNPYNTEKVDKAWNYLRSNMEMLEQTYPNKKFIWWTIPLTQSGQHCTDSLNFRIRKYCTENGKWLFDIADIESHDENDNPVRTETGLQKAYNLWCGANETVNCHPRWTEGAVRLAKAYWSLISRIAGWEGITGSKDENYIHKLLHPLEIVKIYPNPTTGNTVIHFNLLHPSSVTLKLYDLLGRNVLASYKNIAYKAGSNRAQLDCTSFSTGMYYLELSTGTERVVKLLTRN